MPVAQVSCRQIAPIVGDTAGNRSRIADEARRAAAEGARIVVFPELAAHGYSFTDESELRRLAERPDGTLLAEWHGLARELDLVIVAGYAELGEDGHVYNSAAIVDATGVLATYRKAHLWDREHLMFTAGEDRPPVVETAFGRIGVLVCYDLEFPEWVRHVALAGADLLCAPVNWPLYPRPEGERPAEIVRVQADASVNRMAIAACDRTGEDRAQPWLGGSVIVNADGFPLGNLILGRANAVSAEVDLADSRNKRISDHNHVLHDRRPELYGGILAETSKEQS